MQKKIRGSFQQSALSSRPGRNDFGVGPVDQENTLCSPCEGGVKPSVIIGVEAFAEGCSAVDDYVGPLTALSLVTGDRIGIFYLQGVEVPIGAKGLHLLFSSANVAVVFEDSPAQGVGLFAGEGRRVGVQGVEKDCRVEFEVVVVGKGKGDGGETEAVELADVADAADDGHVAVGDEGRDADGVKVFFEGTGEFTLGPVVVVADYHEAVAAAEFVLAVEDGVADAVVVEDGAAVGTADDDGVGLTAAGIAFGNGVYEAGAADTDDVGVA